MEKIVPPIKKVNKADGVKQGSANTTLTTPNDVEGKVWSTGSETGSIMGKK
jgi:hypothetical protein